MGQIAIPEGLQTKLCVLGDSVLKEVPFTVQQLWPGRTVILVADENTWAAAGEAVSGYLKVAGIAQAEPKIYPAEPMLHADYRHSVELCPVIAGKIAIAIGGGTINDIVKLASTDAGNEGYLCVATAASVDGFTSYGAAMTKDGFKQTIPCAAPMAIMADTSVVGTAPEELAASGYADLAAKIPAGADWFIADALGEHPIAPEVWSLVQDELKDWLEDAEGLKAGKSEPMQKLFKGLAMTGFAMQFFHDSRPASGAEHLLSHVWEMDGLEKDGVAPSHGFKVGIGTLMTTALMTELFALSVDEVKAKAALHVGQTPSERGGMIDACLAGTAFHKDTRRVALDKLLTGDKLASRRAEIFEKWDDISGKVKGQLIPFWELRRRFEVLGAPVEPADIGSSRESLYRATIVASMIRKRYTILDLLYELGLLEEMLDVVMAKGYFTKFA